MVRRVAIVGVVLFLALFAVGVFLTAIPKARLASNFVKSQNNLRELALFAAHHTNPTATAQTYPKRNLTKLPNAIPPGTIPLADVPPDQRLSWVVSVLPHFDQKRQSTTDLFAQIDQSKPWLAEPNQKASGTRVVVMVCPENPPDGAVTSYVGIGGFGPDAATLPPGSRRSGAFRYDGPTPFDNITDGLGQTLLFGETRYEVGSWLRGGYATTRGLNDSRDAPPLIAEIGADGQFGGYFADGANFAMCDGGVRTFTSRTAPNVLFAHATIAGKDTDLLPE